MKAKNMDSVNFQSLNMVRDELVASIEESARHLEKFVSTNNDNESLQQCVDGIAQIVGILSLLEFYGAKLLAEELLANATEISPGNTGNHFERRLDVVSSTFFVITRYLEYVQQVEHRAPVLLIPQINELRKLRDKPSLPESHFFNINSNHKYPLPKVLKESYDDPQKFTGVIRRLRHMYQIGLLGLFREKQTANAIALMRRSLLRLHKISGDDNSISLLWWLGGVCLELMVAESMQILETRKTLFGRIDRIIRQVEKSGEAALASDPPKGLIKELVYLISLSGSEREIVLDIKHQYKVDAFPYKDIDLSKQRAIMHGPSAHTVSSLASVLQVELANTKKVLESASQAPVQKIDDLETFIASLQKVAEIMAVVGLTAPGSILKEEISRIEKWKTSNEELDTDEMHEVANTLLYLESAVSGLATSHLSDDRIEAAGKIAQREIIASGALAEAKRIVIAEALAGISLTKRALNSFADSNYDTGHIRNIVKTLDSIRGGMVMLKNERAEKVLIRSSQFVEEILLGQEPQPAIKELLETFADAVISIEYYLNSATAALQMDDSVLKIAEESLEALGFSVEDEE